MSALVGKKSRLFIMSSDDRQTDRRLQTSVCLSVLSVCQRRAEMITPQRQVSVITPRNNPLKVGPLLCKRVMAAAFRAASAGTPSAGLVWPGVSALFPPSSPACSSRDDIKGKTASSPREFSFDWSRGRTGNGKREPSTPFLSAWEGYGEGLPLSSRQVCLRPLRAQARWR